MTAFMDYTAPPALQGFDPTGKAANRRPWLKFNLVDPSKIKVMIVKDNKVRVGTIADKSEADYLVAQMAKAPDGRLVGIFVPIGAHRIPGVNTTQETYLTVPCHVIPQRASMGPSGEQNMPLIHDGRVYRMMIPFDAIKDVEIIKLDQKRDGIPTHRIATQNPNWKPEPGRTKAPKLRRKGG